MGANVAGAEMPALVGDKHAPEKARSNIEQIRRNPLEQSKWLAQKGSAFIPASWSCGGDKNTHFESQGKE